MPRSGTCDRGERPRVLSRLDSVTILLADARVRAVPVLDSREPLVLLDQALGDSVLVRREVARRLDRAAAALPAGIRLRVLEGYRSPADQQRIIDRYTEQVRVHHPGSDAATVRILTSRYVAPLEVAPHVAGAAVDVDLVDPDGRSLDLGCPVDATPEQSQGACYFDAEVSPTARRNRQILAAAMAGSGFVNYPTEWWHWSYGDRYWALISGAGSAMYGPCPQ